MGKSISLKSKILILAGFMTLVTVVVAASSLWFAHRTKEKFEYIVREEVPAIRALNRALLAARLARIELLQILLPGSKPETYAEALKMIDQQWADVDKEVLALSGFFKTDDSRVLFTAFTQALDNIRGPFKNAIEIFRKNQNENSVERREILKIYRDQIGGGAAVELRTTTRALIEYTAKKMEEETKEAEEDARSGLVISIGFAVTGTILSFAIAFIFAQSISNKIKAIVTKISSSTSSVRGASQQVASASLYLSESVTEQAASLQETSASLEEISAMIAKSADNAASTDKSSKQSQDKATEGQTAVTHMTSAMTEISKSNDAIIHQIDESNHQVTQIVKVIEEIGGKTKVINDIVFQTKLLSFNASVEAARAGEHGKGFAVVAEEVGNLARMSGGAAKEIADMLGDSISRVEAIVRESKAKVGPLVADGKQKVTAGVDVAYLCSTVLSEIVENVGNVKILAQEISLAAREQTLGVSEISKAVSQLDSVTQQNSSASQQTSTSAGLLSKEANSLEHAVNELVGLVMGSSPQQHTDGDVRGADAGVADVSRNEFGDTSNKAA